MLLSFSVKNCFIYEDQIDFSMRADMRQKRFGSNVISCNGENVVKAAMIFGPNNAGKTNFVRCLAGVRDILLNRGFGLSKNLFSKEELSEFCIEFIENNKTYSFAAKMYPKRMEYVYERMAKISYDKYKNRKEEDIYIRDNISHNYVCDDEKLRGLMEVAGRNNLLFYLLDTRQFSVLDRVKNVVKAFASRIDVVDMNNMQIKKTIDMMRSNMDTQQRIADFVINADLSMEDFKYLSDEEVKIYLEKVSGGDDNIKPQENALIVENSIVEMLHLSSVYKGMNVPSILFDSAGTKKLAAIAGYVIDALQNGRILIVDELDNSLHSRLTRSIVALFNNELNNNAQLICTAHDISLLDIKKLFRKEQIWFSHKDNERVYLYSLAEFKANKDGVRETTDIIEKYKAGLFGAVPEPDLFKSLQEVYESV